MKLTESVLNQFEKNLASQKQRDVVTRIFGDFFWFITDNENKLPHEFDKLNRGSCKFCKTGHKMASACKGTLLGIMQIAKQTKKIEKFKCYGKFHGFCYPIIQGDKLYGFLIICFLKEEPANNAVEIFSALISNFLREAQKDLELKKLYETIRPRAIALSTVHTLHRLISSTLDLNELLPRIARLTLQVMRANRCSLKLLDAKKKVLLPKATIDLRKRSTKLKKVEIGKWAPGKAVKYSKPIRGRNYLATPLIDEDVIGVITVYDKVDGKRFTDFDEEIMKTLCEQAVIAIKNAQLYKEQERLTMGSIKSIAAILETKDAGSYVPKASFLKLVHLIGVELKLPEHDLKQLQYATLLHDAGQITLPDEITKKQGALTGEEYNLIKEHPKKAAIILKPLKSLKDVVPLILHHHENWDGSGYPMGLKANDIPIGARIMGLVGAFEAMVMPKSYREAMSIDTAISEIKNNAGKQFDPKVVNAFANVIKRNDVLRLLKSEIYGNK